MNNGNIKIEGNKIKLPKLGLVKFENSRRFIGEISSCIIVKTKTDKYFILVLVEEEVKPLPEADKAIALDLLG